MLLTPAHPSGEQVFQLRFFDVSGQQRETYWQKLTFICYMLRNMASVQRHGHLLFLTRFSSLVSHVISRTMYTHNVVGVLCSCVKSAGFKTRLLLPYELPLSVSSTHRHRTQLSLSMKTMCMRQPRPTQYTLTLLVIQSASRYANSITFQFLTSWTTVAHTGSSSRALSETSRKQKGLF